jgi:sulfur relay (sulfurtransferase) DsrF/TusC family protein
MADGIIGGGFNLPKQDTTSPWGTESYTEAPAAAFAASDMSTQGNAGLNQEGSYDMGNRAETNAYPESENM